MTKLTQAQIKQKNDLLDKLRRKKVILAEAVDLYNSELQDASGKLKDVVDEYNEALVAMTNFINECAEEISSYYEEKSEKWQEGDTGAAYAEWMEAWANGSEFEEYRFEEPCEADEPDDDFESIEDLPDAPE